MKQLAARPKLGLNKKTITQLDAQHQNKVNGGQQNASFNTVSSALYCDTMTCCSYSVCSAFFCDAQQ